MINFSDIHFYNLTKPSCDFDCLPRTSQISYLAEFLLYEGNKTFTTSDISDLFKKANLVSPRTKKIIKVSKEQIETHLDNSIGQGELPLLKDGEGIYRFVEEDFDFTTISELVK